MQAEPAAGHMRSQPPNLGLQCGQDAYAAPQGGTVESPVPGTSGGFSVMGKNKDKSGHGKPKGEAAGMPVMKRLEFEKLVKPLHGELVAVQEWVKSTGA